MPESYPVGAMWEFVAPEGIGILSGAVGRVWLERRTEGCEMWRWSWKYKSEKGGSGDWNPTRRSAVEECKIHFAEKCKVRFKRVENDS